MGNQTEVLELKSIITKIEYSLKVFNRRFEQAKELVNWMVD